MKQNTFPHAQVADSVFFLFIGSHSRHYGQTLRDNIYIFVCTYVCIYFMCTHALVHVRECFLLVWTHSHHCGQSECGVYLYT